MASICADTPAIGTRFSCRICGVVFADLAGQRSHFGGEEHRLAVAGGGDGDSSPALGARAAIAAAAAASRFDDPAEHLKYVAKTRWGESPFAIVHAGSFLVRVVSAKH